MREDSKLNPVCSQKYLQHMAPDCTAGVSGSELAHQLGEQRSRQPSVVGNLSYPQAESEESEAQVSMCKNDRGGKVFYPKSRRAVLGSPLSSRLIR